MPNMAITVDAVSKHFHVVHGRPATLRGAVVRRLGGRAERRRTVVALDDVSFTVPPGRAVGVIGHNGAGKSTLLRLLCGLGRPTRGAIARDGHVSGLLELGGGFHLDLTGRENAVTAGVLSGLTAREARAQLPPIVAFAELEEVIDHPVRTYSSGMYLRLAFAVAVHFDPAILVIDEVLAVGDARFQARCLDRIARFRAAGRTLVLTSHIPEQIRALCDDVVVLDEGRLVARDRPEAALRCYDELMRARTARRARALGATAPPSDGGPPGSDRQGTGEAAIDAVRISADDGVATSAFRPGNPLAIEIDYRLAPALEDVALGLGIYSAADVRCFEIVVDSASRLLGPLGERGTVVCRLPAPSLLPGRYHLSVGLYPPGCDWVYDYHWRMHPFSIVSDAVGTAAVSGIVDLHATWALVAPGAPGARLHG